MPDGWGTGTKIEQTASSFPEYRYKVGPIVIVEKRTVTDETELWVGMTKSDAGTKRTELIGTEGYISAVRQYVGGGQFQVTATKRTYGAWAEV